MIKGLETRFRHQRGGHHGRRHDRSSARAGPRLHRAERRLNIAGIGVGGMGRTNLLNLGLDNNIVALCDVDWGYAGPQWTADAFDAALKREQERLLKTDLTAGSAQEQRASRRIAQAHPRRGPAEAEALHRLPPDARAAEGHRRGRRRHARSHARADRHGRARSRQARLRAEAAEPGRSTKRASWRARRGRHRRPSRRWATRATRGTTGARPVEWVQSGAIGDVHRSARVDQSSALVLAAGHSASRAAADFRATCAGT